MGQVQAGILMLAGAIAIVELWRRGYLGDLIASIGKPTSRPFRLPTASEPDTFLGGPVITP